jgi:hypothetical protein
MGIRVYVLGMACHVMCQSLYGAFNKIIFEIEQTWISLDRYELKLNLLCKHYCRLHTVSLRMLRRTVNITFGRPLFRSLKRKERNRKDILASCSLFCTIMRLCYYLIYCPLSGMKYCVLIIFSIGLITRLGPLL